MGGVMNSLPSDWNSLSFKQGWVCPKCASVMAPTMMMCFYCKPKKVINYGVLINEVKNVDKT